MSRLLPLALLSLVLVGGCERGRSSERSEPTSEAAPAAPPPESPETAASSAQEAASATGPGAEEPEVEEPTAPTCPEGMVLLPGGPFWAGAEHESFASEENPRFLTRLAPFCLDPTEVTAAAYERCVEAGACRPARTEYKTCNYKRAGRADHPINCIDHDEATAYCAWRGARLPSELEWEYAARGGAEQRKYPWGDDSPDGKTCWKQPHSCAVGSFPAGAFGLHDVVGNVWEWTEDWFAPYPWPAASGRHRVYRGGSWSRRFEKWLRPTLRNRFAPDHWGSHLGVRCAAFAEPLDCPYGVEPAEEGDVASRSAGAETGSERKAQRCRRGVDDAQCLGGKRWNGVRCADPGAPRCPAGAEVVPGRGCVGGGGMEAPRAAGSRGGAGAPEESAAEVRRVRSPEFDEDCRQNSPTRPHAHRLEGGTHAARNAVGAKHGCKNRDVGVGWNSACCP